MRGIDYAGGRISGAVIKRAGYDFVCRYLSYGGPSLPGKLLLPDEARDLLANGVDIVSNWETTADRMLAGFDAGRYDAQAGLNQVLACGGRRDRPIYFSCDIDASPGQQGVIDDYLRGAATVLGVENVGVYGGYWVVKRCFDNGTIRWGWQTSAWSGWPPNRDERAHIYQDFNRPGGMYVNVGGVQCDYDEALKEDFGQWTHYLTGGWLMALSDAEQAELLDGVRLIRNQLLGTPDPNRPGVAPGWPQLGDKTVVDALADVRDQVARPWRQLGKNAAGQDRTLVDAIADEVVKPNAK
jgi:hypothetical protein